MSVNAVNNTTILYYNIIYSFIEVFTMPKLGLTDHKNVFTMFTIFYGVWSRLGGGFSEQHDGREYIL